MPLDSSSFPEEVQMAFFMCSYISDRWDGMSGTYLGKNWLEAEHLFKLYDLNKLQQTETLYFMKMYDAFVTKKRHEESERKRKASEAKHGGGKNYTHNVKG